MAHMYFCTTITIDGNKMNSNNMLFYLYKDDLSLQLKLKFMFVYFKNAIDEVHKSQSQRYITFFRNSLPIKNDIKYQLGEECIWNTSAKPLSHVILENKLRIEDYAGPDSMMIDFANEYVGGGCLTYGSVQEEILFLIYPELNTVCLFSERMQSNEAIIMKGARRYADYSGYGYNLLFRD